MNYKKPFIFFLKDEGLFPLCISDVKPQMVCIFKKK